jgi:hypothetical protein
VFGGSHGVVGMNVEGGAVPPTAPVQDRVVEVEEMD